MTMAPAIHPAAKAEGKPATPGTNVSVDCGWGRLLFGQTFAHPAELVETLLDEQPGKRDIAFHVADPHVIVALAPFDLFLDPSHTYRLPLGLDMGEARPREGFRIRRLAQRGDIDAVNRICAIHGMVQIDPAMVWPLGDDPVRSYLVAEDADSGQVIGSATGIDHAAAFGDPENGSSLWCLAVDPQSARPGVGEGLVRALAEHFRAAGRSFMDLSVMHNNTQAIALYEKLGFERVPTFTIKTKNSFNEKLFTGPSLEADLNPYAQIITNEARRRGIVVDVIDVPSSLFRLSLGGRSVVCRESLSSATSATAMTICDDKALTRRILVGANLRVPAQCVATDEAAAAVFLREYGAVVVKPARGEQGRGIAVNLTTEEEVAQAVEEARRHCETVLIEEFVSGQDLRIVVIDFKVVAAAIRRPAQVIGTGAHTVRELIDIQSRRRAAATGGESRIPVDAETERCVAAAGHDMDSVLAAGEKLFVRRAANLHTGGTIHDVTDEIHGDLVEAAVQAAKAIDIPVVGLDLIVPDVSRSTHWFIEANERPGLANHEPQPTAERFVDMLFPQTASTLRGRRA
jgi:GNAT-family acetyltransferase (TIGR03103 family)